MKRAWINVGVGVGCVGLLVALILPAIQQSREAARRSQCRNNLKQLGLAFQNYHATNSRLPPGFWSNSGWGWRALIQPYTEASPLYQSLRIHQGRLGDWSENPKRGDNIRIPRPYDQCPSDSPKIERAEAIQPVRLYRGQDGEEKRYDISDQIQVFLKTAIRTSENGERRPIAMSNYIAVYGDLEIACPTNRGTGLYWQNSAVSLDADVPDGLSMTLMLGERDGSIHLAGNWAGTSYDENDPEACLDPQFVVDALVDSRPINGRDERCFSSRHSGGAHFLFADGAVKFINEKCSTTILRRLANRADGIEVNDVDLP